MAKKKGSSKKKKSSGEVEPALNVLEDDGQPPEAATTAPKKSKKKKKASTKTMEDEEAQNPVTPKTKKKKKKSAVLEERATPQEEYNHDEKQARGLVSYDEEANQPSRPRRSNNRPSGPPPMDDFSAMSDDDQEDFDKSLDDEPRFKYSTAELSDSSCRNSRCCLITVGIICLIVAVALSIMMIKIFEKNDKENRADSPTLAPTAVGGGQPGVTLFQLPRETVEGARCPLGEANSNSCRNTCSEFDCCDPLSEDDCYMYNPDGCLNYRRCHATNSGIQIPPANLGSICSPASVASNRQQCENACASVACCWESDVTCYDKFYACLDYSPCQNLRPRNRVPAAPADVEKFCDSTQTGSISQPTACEDACRVAECCWSKGADNCLETDLLTCMTYSPCSQLSLPAAGNTVTLPPPSLRNDCSVAFINSGNTANCETSCSAGACCLVPDSSCFQQDPLACLAYEPCRALDGASV